MVPAIESNAVAPTVSRAERTRRREFGRRSLEVIRGGVPSSLHRGIGGLRPLLRSLRHRLGCDAKIVQLSHSGDLPEYFRHVFIGWYQFLLKAIERLGDGERWVRMFRISKSDLWNLRVAAVVVSLHSGNVRQKIPPPAGIVKVLHPFSVEPFVPAHDRLKS